MNAKYALLLVYKCEYVIEHDESCSTAVQVVARIQSSDDTILQASRHGVIKLNGRHHRGYELEKEHQVLINCKCFASLLHHTA